MVLMVLESAFVVDNATLMLLDDGNNNSLLFVFSKKITPSKRCINDKTRI